MGGDSGGWKRGGFQPPGGRTPLTDPQIAELRGIADRGIRKGPPPAEPISSFYDFATGKIVGCADKIELAPLPRDAQASEVRRLVALSGTYATFRDGTACLLRLASIIEESLNNELFVRFPDSFFALVETMVSICETIIQRTKAPYGLFADANRYQRLDARVLLISPIKDYKNWRSLYDGRNRIRAGKALVLEPPQIGEQPILIRDKAAWHKALDQIDERLDAMMVDAQLSAAMTGDMPLVRKHIQNLRLLKFSHIEAQTRARYPNWKRDSVYEHVELMVYNSVYSVVLDKQGNPAFLGSFPYALIIPSPGKEMQRRLQSWKPSGLYLSTGTLADYQLAVNGLEVKSILFGGVGGFVGTGNTFTWEHELQTKLQRYINFNSFHALPTITVQEAFNSGELSIEKVWDRLPDIIDATGRYAFDEVLRRLSDPNLYENYDEILLRVGVEIIRDLIVEAIKDWARQYLIKKIGQKIIPGLNLISAFSELIDDSESEMIRASIACVIMATRSSSQDDMAISSKILAKIAVDKVQQEVVAKLSSLAGKQLKKVKKPATPKTQPEGPKAPAADTPAPATPPASDVQGPVKQEGAAAGKPYDVVTHSSPQQMADAARLTYQGQQQPGADKRTHGDPGVDNRTVPNTDAPTAATGPETVEIAPGVFRRRGKKGAKDTTAPSHEDSSDLAADGDDDDGGLADAQRGLRQRGKEDQKVDSSEVDEVRRSRHVRDRKDGNEDGGDSAVLAKNMKKEGRLREGADDEAHHIIPAGEPQAAEVVAILAQKGIGVNEGFNGVYLTRGAGENVTGSYKHEFTFAKNPEYFVLLKGLVKRSDSPEAIRGKIRVLGGFLADGQLPTYRQVIDSWSKTRASR